MLWYFDLWDTFGLPLNWSKGMIHRRSVAGIKSLELFEGKPRCNTPRCQTVQHSFGRQRWWISFRASCSSFTSFTTGTFKLCDFGISGRLVDSKAKTRCAGCVAYMAVGVCQDFCVNLPWYLWAPVAFIALVGNLHFTPAFRDDVFSFCCLALFWIPQNSSTGQI